MKNKKTLVICNNYQFIWCKRQLLKYLIFFFCCYFSSISAQSKLQESSVFNYSENLVLDSEKQHYWQALQAGAVENSERFVRLSPENILYKNTLLLNLPKSKLILDFVTTKKKKSGRYQIKGKILGKTGSFLLVYNPKKEMFTGRISIGTENWQLMPLQGGLHTLFIPKDIGEDCIEPQVPKETATTEGINSGSDAYISPESNLENSFAGECKIRLLVAYSDEVANSASDITSRIDLLVMEFNDINEESEVDFEVVLACVEEVNITEDNAFNSDGRWIDLEQFKDPNDDKIDFIHEQRNQYDADMAILLVSESIPVTGGGEILGQAYAIGANSSTAFCISVWDNFTFTFTHEFGHLLGMRHNNDNTVTPYSYGHGYINDDNVSGDNFRTVMGVNGSCDGSCSRIPRWSSNNLLFSGNPTGNSSFSDNARVGRVSETIAASWESTITNKTQFRDSEIVNDDEQIHLLAGSTYSSNDKTIELRSGSIGSIVAGQSIHLLPGFRALSGSQFSAVLDDCTDNALTESDDMLQERNIASPNMKFDQSEFELNLKITPNPVQDKLHVHIELNTPSIVAIELLDMSGRGIRRHTTNKLLDSNTHSVIIDMADLANGFYFLKVVTFNGIKTQKIIKANSYR